MDARQVALLVLIFIVIVHFLRVRERWEKKDKKALVDTLSLFLDIAVLIWLIASEFSAYFVWLFP